MGMDMDRWDRLSCTLPRIFKAMRSNVPWDGACRPTKENPWLTASDDPKVVRSTSNWQASILRGLMPCSKAGGSDER
jgi:hypothetical protein